jgi:hypothetical protein
MGQQKAVASDEMTLVDPEVTPVGSSSVATPSMAIKVSEEVDMSIPDSEKLEAQPECTRTTDIASCNILDQKDVLLHGGRSDDKKVVEQQAVVLEAMTRATPVVDVASPCNLVMRVGPTINWSVGAAIPSVRAIAGIMAPSGRGGIAKEAIPRGAPSKRKDCIARCKRELY